MNRERDLKVAQVIHAVNFDDINVLRVEPVVWPRVNEFEPVASVLEAAIPAVIGLADMKRVFPSKIGLETVFGNAATTGMLRLLSRLSLLCVFPFGLGALLLLGRGFFLLFCGLLWLRFLLFLFGRLGFLLLRLLLLSKPELLC